MISGAEPLKKSSPLIGKTKIAYTVKKGIGVFYSQRFKYRRKCLLRLQDAPVIHRC